MSPKDNKEFVARHFEEFWNNKKLEMAKDFYAPNYKMEDPTAPITTKGPDAAIEYRKLWLKVSPDLNMKMEEQVAENDMVVTRFSCTGTHAGELMGFPPTNRKVNAGMIVIQKLENGKIAETRLLWDTMAFFRDTGMLERMRTATPAYTR